MTLKQGDLKSNFDDLNINAEQSIHKILFNIYLGGDEQRKTIKGENMFHPFPFSQML